jgi:PAS domain S-box-containing protein
VSEGIPAFEGSLSKRSLLSRVKALDPVRRNVYLLLGAFWLAALGLAWASYAYYWNQRNAIETEERRRLEAIAELKVRQIREWRNERLADARILGSSPISPPVQRFFGGHATAGDQAEIAVWLDAIRSASGYANVILINPERKLWMARGENTHAPDLYFDLAQRVMLEGEVELSDFHLDTGLRMPHLGLNIPLRVASSEKPVGALLIAIDPKLRLYPLVQLWPTSSATAETLLARREGDEVVYLNELRHQGGVALKLRLPASEPRLPAALGANGFEGLVSGVDYRGVPVLAAVRRVPDVSWILVAKVDLAEVRAPIERQVFWLGLIACSVVLIFGIGVALLLRDLKARFDLQRYLSEVEQRALQGHYDLLSRYANDIILLADEAGLIVEANDRAVSSYGYSRGELIGMPLTKLRAPETLSESEPDGLRTAGDSAIFETRHIRKDGTTVPVEVSARRVTADNAVFRQCIIRDITERKEAEKEKARLEEQLQQSQRLKSIGRLAGGVAHDFNNLLTVINGYSSMVMETLPAHDPLCEPVQEIFDAGERAANLTRQLLAFSRKQVIAPKLLNLNALVSELVKMLRRLVGEDVSVVTRLDSSVDPVFVDQSQMEQVLMNLTTNARDAMPGGGELLIETQNVLINEEYASTHVGAKAGEHVLLAVSDNGVGMSPETLERAFEPFFTTKPRGQGTGLGLAMVYGIVEQNGGWIFVYSEPGKGTSFKIYLPGVRDGDATALDTGAERPVVLDARGSETVLIVEDQAEVRRLAVEALRRYGYRVIEAASGEEALALAGSLPEEIHLLVTDVVMPGITGPVLANRLTSARPQLKVLYMSGYTENLVARQGILEEGTLYLQKPFTAGVLAARVRAVLES